MKKPITLAEIVQMICQLEAHHEVAKLELEEAACGQLEDDDVR